MKVKAMANSFIIWREASSVDWDCTARELAEATGLPYKTVTQVLRNKGWSDRVMDGMSRKGTHNSHRLSVDRAMATRDLSWLGRA